MVQARQETLMDKIRVETTMAAAANIELKKPQNQNGDHKPMCLVWEDLTVVLPSMIRNGVARKLLSDLNGFAEAGRIMAIMGPSGSGKSTLLDSLAGRLSPNVIMTGNVLINGKKKTINCRDVSYVSPEDVFLGTLTVRETITYSAHLRFPAEIPNEEIKNAVEKTISDMGLQDCADNKIGNWHLRGISSGEKKRLRIGLEIVTNPHVLFLDEPTSGLDSASAFIVIQALRNTARDGKIFVCSIHQPSSDVFDMFDDLLLLSAGEAVYFGEAKAAMKFFADSGFPCPTRRNPSDHFLRCICLDFDNVNAALKRTQRNWGIPASSGSLMNMTTAEIKAALVEKYKQSDYSITARARIRELALTEGNVEEANKGSNGAGWGKQLCTLSHRSLQNMTRDIGYYWLRIIFYILVAISVGTLHFNIGEDNGAILARAKCASFIYGFMVCLSIGGLPFFIEEMKVFYRERFNGYYGDAVFVISNFISSIPFLVALSIFSGTIMYYMVKFHPGFSHCGFFCINLFCCISVVETYMMIIAALVPNVLMGIGTGTSLTVFMMMASQMFRPISDLPKVFWRYPMSYISFAKWAIQGQYKNDMIGLEFDPLVGGDPKLKGEAVLQTIFGVPLDHSKWLDLTALTCLVFANRLLFYIILKYKQRVSSKFSMIPARRTFRRLAGGDFHGEGMYDIIQEVQNSPSVIFSRGY